MPARITPKGINTPSVPLFKYALPANLRWSHQASQSNRVCGSCTLGQSYTNEVNSVSCTAVQDCEAGHIRLKPQRCPRTAYARRALWAKITQGINNLTCTPVQECVAGEYVVAVPTAISDRMCGSCTLGQSYSTDVNTSSCSPVQNCHAGQYEMAAPTLIANRVCGECILGVDYSQHEQFV